MVADAVCRGARRNGECWVMVKREYANFCIHIYAELPVFARVPVDSNVVAIGLCYKCILQHNYYADKMNENEI